MTIAVLLFIIAAVCMLVAFFKTMTIMARQSVERTIVRLRKEKLMQEAEVAEMGEILACIETGLREGKNGAVTRIRSNTFTISPTTFSQYCESLRLSKSALDQTVSSLLAHEDVQKRLGK